MAAPRRSTQEIVPEDHFSAWAYPIPQALWGSLGVEKREYIDKPATKVLRDDARAQGKDAKEVAKLKIMRKAWIDCGMPDFHEFDLFWSEARDHALQIISIKDMIEVHRVEQGALRRAYVMTEKQFVACLKTGRLPEETRIWRAKSQSEVLRFSIEDPQTAETTEIEAEPYPAEARD
ncbi:MAG: hypothetical protein L6Q69_18195, partial [Zoogloea sp.]|nr:hypothetical protein [Zoogloea sp.]